MKKSIVISFVKGKLFPQEIPFHSVYTMRERSSFKELSDIMELHYIELDKIRCDGKQLSEMSDLEQLGAYMKCSGNPEEKAYVEELVKKGDEVIGMTDTVLKKISEEDKLRELRIAREKWEMWVMLERTAGYDNGYDNGKADGEQIGIEKGKVEVAANLKKAGIDIEIIAATTGLSKEEIEQL